jgi:hypothetical protein
MKTKLESQHVSMHVSQAELKDNPSKEYIKVQSNDVFHIKMMEAQRRSNMTEQYPIKEEIV